MLFKPLSLTNLTQFLGFPTLRHTKRLLEHPEEELKKLALTHPHWARYLSHLLLGQPEGPEVVGERRVLPVRDTRGMSPQVALVPQDTPYGVYHYGLILAPSSISFRPGTFLLLPGAYSPNGDFLEPVTFTLRQRRFPARVRPFARVLGEVDEEKAILTNL